MNIENFYNLIVYINLDSRPDRKLLVEKEFAKLGIDPIRIPGQVFTKTNNSNANGVAGCILSHMKALQLALETKSNILIFEDDVKFINDFATIIPKALDEISDMAWDMLYFGGNICNTVTQISPHLGELTWAQSTHAYSVNRNFVEKLLNSIPNQIYPLDLTYTHNIIPNNNCYITIPMVAVQQKSFSDIEGQEVEYESWMEKRFYANLVKMDIDKK